MNNIIKAFIDAFKQIFLTKFVFGSLGSVVAAFYLPQKIFNCTEKQSWTIALIVLGVWYLLVFLYKLWENYKVWFTNHFFDSIWGDGIILIKMVTDEKEKVKLGQQKAHDAIKKTCNELKKFFEKKTKKECSVSVKVPKEPGVKLEDMVVVNICRDDTSEKIRNTSVYNAQVHQLFGNTAYSAIVTRMYNKKTRAYYMNNHVDKDSNYETTSSDAYVKGLPYKSEFVFPLTDLPVEITKGPSEISGFLCVDCKEENGFSDDRYSVHLMKCIASNLNKIINTINEDGKSENNVERS
ncbi:MAG: hypothetical protein IJP44_02770 [Bacteroidales bacterium]|nr:hypothetical protein [Bacteroidales bacterium]